MSDTLAEIRARDALKGHSGAGVTMTRAEADRRTLLRMLDEARAEIDQLTNRVTADEDGHWDVLIERDALRRRLDAVEGGE